MKVIKVVEEVEVEEVEEVEVPVSGGRQLTPWQQLCGRVVFLHSFTTDYTGGS